MRSFRASVVGGAVLVVLAVTVACTPKSAQHSTNDSYFPLSVGNYWSYRCSVEGEHQFDKTVRIVSAVTRQGVRYFRTELTVTGQNDSLVYFHYRDADGSVFVGPGVGRDDSEILITAEPKVGDKIGNLVVGDTETVVVPAVGELLAIRLESFALDDPAIPEERRMEWLGRFYALGVGLVAEGDGLGGECMLETYHVGNR